MNRSIVGLIEESDSQYHLVKAKLKVQHDVQTIKRTREGEYGKFTTFAGFVSGISDAMQNAGIEYRQLLSGGRDGGTFLTTRLSVAIEDGDTKAVEWMQATFQLPGVGDVQEQASELTQWKKHHLASMLGITWEDRADDDGQAAAEAWRRDADAKALAIFDKADAMLRNEKDAEKREAIFARLRAVAEKGELPVELLKKLEAQHAE